MKKMLLFLLVNVVTLNSAIADCNDLKTVEERRQCNVEALVKRIVVEGIGLVGGGFVTEAVANRKINKTQQQIGEITKRTFESRIDFSGRVLAPTQYELNHQISSLAAHSGNIKVEDIQAAAPHLSAVEAQRVHTQLLRSIGEGVQRLEEIKAASNLNGAARNQELIKAAVQLDAELRASGIKINKLENTLSYKSAKIAKSNIGRLLGYGTIYLTIGSMAEASYVALNEDGKSVDWSGWFKRIYDGAKSYAPRATASDSTQSKPAPVKADSTTAK